MEEFLIRLVESLPLAGALPNANSYIWPVAEVLHFVGLTLLIGAIGILDLRMLGMAKGLAPAVVHRLVPIGILGFGLSSASGLVFLSGNPAGYIHNPGFQLKMLFMLIAGVNVAVFYLFFFRKTAALPAGADLPAGPKVIAGVSLAMWFAVIVMGRIMAFF